MAPSLKEKAKSRLLESLQPIELIEICIIADKQQTPSSNLPALEECKNSVTAIFDLGRERLKAVANTKNSVVRVLSHEFYFYQNSGPLSGDDFISLLSHLELLFTNNTSIQQDETDLTNLHLLLGSFPVYANDKLYNITIYAQGDSPVAIHYFAKRISADIDLTYQLSGQDLPLANDLARLPWLENSNVILNNSSNFSVTHDPVVTAKTAGGISFFVPIDICLDNRFKFAEKTLFTKVFNSTVPTGYKANLPLQMTSVILASDLEIVSQPEKQSNRLAHTINPLGETLLVDHNYVAYVDPNKTMRLQQANSSLGESPAKVRSRVIYLPVRKAGLLPPELLLKQLLPQCEPLFNIDNKIDLEPILASIQMHYDEEYYQSLISNEVCLAAVEQYIGQKNLDNLSAPLTKELFIALEPLQKPSLELAIRCKNEWLVNKAIKQPLSANEIEKLLPQIVNAKAQSVITVFLNHLSADQHSEQELLTHCLNFAIKSTDLKLFDAISLSRVGQNHPDRLQSYQHNLLINSFVQSSYGDLTQFLGLLDNSDITVDINFSTEVNINRLLYQLPQHPLLSPQQITKLLKLMKKPTLTSFVGHLNEHAAEFNIESQLKNLIDAVIGDNDLIDRLVMDLLSSYTHAELIESFISVYNQQLSAQEQQSFIESLTRVFPELDESDIYGEKYTSLSKTIFASTDTAEDDIDSVGFATNPAHFFHHSSDKSDDEEVEQPEETPTFKKE